MSLFLSNDLELPAGTVVALEESGASLSFTWRSHRGLHIVRSDIPTKWCREEQCSLALSDAVRSFKIAIASEVVEAELAEQRSSA